LSNDERAFFNLSIISIEYRQFLRKIKTRHCICTAVACFSFTGYLMLLSMANQQQIFPNEVIENTTEVYLPSVELRSKIIYWLILLAMTTALLSMPFIYVDVSVQSDGLVKTIAEKGEIRPLVAGRIASVSISENQQVRAGQTLYLLQTEVLDTKLRLNTYQQQEKQRFINDLTRLVALDSASFFKPIRFFSPLYQQQYNQFVMTLRESIIQQKKLAKELGADAYLYQEKVIAMREFDDKQFSYNNSVASYRSMVERQISMWASELSANQIALVELQAQAKQLHEEKQLYTIKAPIAGTVQQLTGKYAGSTVQAGENLGVISPDSTLLVECYVPPADIGFIKKGLIAFFQVNAFNYNQWGLAEGRVIDVSKDAVMIQNIPTFKVRCSLTTKALRLKNGYVGNLKKGMSLKARFSIARRSIYQLLYDKIDNWVNPKLN
jgi:membrane fusion protein, peptide pheromone/bacteriocin exporter